MRRLIIALTPAALFVALAWPALRENSATYDETEHVPAGYTYLTRHDYRLGPEHPPLLKALFTLPLLPLAPRISVEAERAFEAATRTIDAHWIFGDRFLYRDNQPEPLLLRARMVVLALAAVLVLLVFRWTRDVCGPTGAFFAATLVALDPNLLAHGSLATTDAGFALLFFAALYLARRAFLALTPANLIGTGAVIGAAVASKHSALLLAPTLAIFGLLRLADRTPWPLPWKAEGARRVVGRGAVVFLVLGCWSLLAWGSLWAAYGFRYTARADGPPTLPIADWAHAIRENEIYAEQPTGASPLDDATVARLVAAKPPGLAERTILVAESRRLLPEAYLFGLAFATAKAQFRWGYFLGEISGAGHLGYFPLAFVVKTPVAALLTLTLALVLAARAMLFIPRRAPAAPDAVTVTHALSWREAIYLSAPPAVVLASATASHLNIGYRHVLPMLPFLYALTGAIPAALTRRIGRRASAAALAVTMLLVAAETLAARPYFLPFFNVVAGGAPGGLRLLSDSNLDWGQGLPALRRWMAEQHVPEVDLCYFGTADPAAYGIRFVPLTGSYVLDVPGAGRAGWTPRAPVLPGYVVMSATNLQGTYLLPHERDFYAFLRRKRPVTILAGSIYVYWVERWAE
ncbi:MAG: glycosyltransferase family 39 protein [Deltaproteobacteria bacterium]|nr:glycosyltransferase family 39 protein [Deltaproteobacteria bacterium]